MLWVVMVTFEGEDDVLPRPIYTFRQDGTTSPTVPCLIYVLTETLYKVGQFYNPNTRMIYMARVGNPSVLDRIALLPLGNGCQSPLSSLIWSLMSDPRNLAYTVRAWMPSMCWVATGTGFHTVT